MVPWKGDLDGIVKRRQVRMLVTFSKTGYFIDKADQRGATYEAGRLFEEFLNQRLKSKTIRVHVVFIPVSRDRIFKDLAEGRGDIAAANLTITPDRRERVDFSAPLLEGVRERVVTAPDQPAVTTVDDLSGREIYVRRSSSYHASLTRLNASLRASGKSPVKIVAAPEALEDEDLLEMVNAGLMPATVVDEHLTDFWSQLFTKMRVTSVDVASDGRIAWAIRKGAPELRKAVDAFVRANSKGSKNFNLIYQRYLKSTAFVKSSSSESEMRKFQQLRGFFQKYGQQYSVPWLLLAAQGYQESELDQSVRSRAGAVGVMQIKPSTAAGFPDQHHGRRDERREEHPGRREVPAVHHGPVLPQGADGSAQPRALRRGVLQRGAGPHRATAAQGQGDAARIRTCGLATSRSSRRARSAARP